MNNFDIERLKDANPLEDIIAEDGVTLTPQGKSMVGYHSNKHDSRSKASLHIDTVQGVYHCFNCGEGGDVITWLMKNRSMTFIEACQYLSARAGIELPDINPEEQKRQNERRYEQEQLWDLYTATADIYHSVLDENGYKLLLDKWGLTEETAKKYKFGFAPVNEKFIAQKLLKRGFSQELINRSGLVNRGGYDYFQGRLIFPYWRSGRVVYFIARLVDGVTPKEDWQETRFIKLPVHNEKHPYVSEAVNNEFFAGEDTARGATELIITEGIADCYAAIQAGFACISPVTVTFRKEDFPRMTQLARRAKTVWLINDVEKNKAGEKGALITAEHLEGQGISAKLVELPRPEGAEKVDLADYLKEHTADELKVLLNNAKTLLELVLEKLRQDPKNSEALQEAIGRIARLEGTQRDIFIDTLYQTIKKIGIKKLTIEKAVKEVAGIIGEKETTNQTKRARSKVKDKERKPIQQTSFFVNGENIFEQIYVGGKSLFLTFNTTTNETEMIPFLELEEKIIEPVVGEDVELGAVQLPSGIEQYGDTLSLLNEIENHIYSYLDVSQDYLKFASYYVLLTWLYDRFHTVPYLRTLGDTGCGKSRFLDTIGGLCYKAISASGCITPAPIYRMLRKWGGTLVLDEADMKNSDMYSEVVTILNCGFEKRRPVIRAIKDDPNKIQVLPVYGPKVFATRRRFKDTALEARCLTEIMQETDRDNIPPVLGKKFFEEQQKLRNKLLLFRLRNYFNVDPEAAITLNMDGIEPRLKQISEAFASLFANELEVLESYRCFIRAHQKELIEQRAATKTGQVVETLFEILKENMFSVPSVPSVPSVMVDNEVGTGISSGDIAEKTGLSSQAVGSILKGLGLETKKMRQFDKNRRMILYDHNRFEKLRRRYILQEQEERKDKIENVPSSLSTITVGTIGTLGTLEHITEEKKEPKKLSQPEHSQDKASDNSDKEDFEV